jgi:hypothetical protein
MAAGFVHETLDLISWGRVYTHIHRCKDEHAQQAPGLRHREVGHVWYHSYGDLWDFDDPFPRSIREEIRSIGERSGPEAAEERMASDGHDFLDRIWDELSEPERRYREGFFVWLLYRPDLLESWVGVDVLRGRISRTIDGGSVWENSPETVDEYRSLHRRVSKNHKHRLRNVLMSYGN